MKKKFTIGCKHGILWLIKDLIDNGFNPSINQNNYLYVALYYHNNDVIKLLLNDQRVIDKLDDDEIKKFNKL